MKTTTLFAELVVVGTGATLFVLLLFCLITSSCVLPEGTENGITTIIDAVKELTPSISSIFALIPVLSVMYMLGIVVNNLSYRLFSPFENNLREDRLYLYLFSVTLSFVSELDAGQLSETLRERFREHGVALSSTAQIVVEQPRSKWMIHDAGKKHLIQSENQTLNVYLYFRRDGIVDKLYRSNYTDMIGDFEFRRSKVRICRGWFVNSLLIYVTLGTRLGFLILPDSGIKSLPSLGLFLFFVLPIVLAVYWWYTKDSANWLKGLEEKLKGNRLILPFVFAALGVYSLLAYLLIFVQGPTDKLKLLWFGLFFFFLLLIGLAVSWYAATVVELTKLKVFEEGNRRSSAAKDPADAPDETS
jgi:hypothetical protein